MHQHKSPINVSFYLRLALFLFLLASVYSLLALTQELAYIFSRLAFHQDAIKWNQAAFDALYKVKPFEFTFYLMGCCICCIYSGYAYKLISQQQLEYFLKLDLKKYPLDKTKHQIIRISLLAIAHFLYGYLIQATSFQVVCLHVIYWIFLFQLPRLFKESQSPLMNLARDLAYRIEIYDYKKLPPPRAISAVLIILAFLEFLYLLFPFFERPKIMNDFLNLPETTLIENVPVDNLTYIESHHLLSLHNRYDPRRDLGISPTFAPAEFFRLGVGGSHFTELLNNPNSSTDNQYTYPEQEISSSLRQAMHQQETQLLIDKPSEQESLFLTYNFIELNWQILGNSILHHQGHFYLPANDFDKGRNTDEILTVYGRFTIYLSWALMYLMGGTSISHIYIVSGIYYLTYYVMLVFAAKIICEKWEYAIAAAHLSTFCYISLGFILLYLGPGFNPIRHCFDIFGLLCFYTFTKRKNVLSILAVIGVLFLAISNDKAFGIMLTGAFFSALAYLHIKVRPKISRYVSFVGYVGTIGLGIFTIAHHSGPTVVDYYFILGLGAFPAEQGSLFILLFFIAILIILTVTITNAQLSPLALTTLFWGLYCLGALLYTVWGSRWSHFWNLAPIYILFGLLIIRLLYKIQNISMIYFESLVLRLFLVLLFMLNACLLFGISAQHSVYTDIFLYHKTYIWPYAKARVESTVNPKYLSDSVNLLGKYSQSNGVYILSQYDYILPFLADKYSAMPYPDLSHYLITEEDNAKTVAFLKKEKPTYLFVDRDVNRVMGVDIIGPDSWYARIGGHAPQNTMIPDISNSSLGLMYDISIARAFRIYNLHKIFSSIENNYEPVESSLLLTVYKHR